MAGQKNQVQGDEPPMYLQRPSSARSQDISHVLARTFRQLFTRDAVGPDKVQYLNTSRGGDDEYHEKYVEALRQVESVLIYHICIDLLILNVNFIKKGK